MGPENKGFRLLGHPVHALLSDFPLALLGTSLIWDVIGIVRGEAIWWAISFWDMALGVAAGVAAATAGAADYAAISRDNPALTTATRHMFLMGSAVSLYSVAMLVRGGPSPPTDLSRIATLVLEAAGLVLLVVGGWHGGHLVFHHGIGRDKRPGE
jgi:uncharacterized membrane protein